MSMLNRCALLVSFVHLRLHLCDCVHVWRWLGLCGCLFVCAFLSIGMASVHPLQLDVADSTRRSPHAVYMVRSLLRPDGTVQTSQFTLDQFPSFINGNEVQLFVQTHGMVHLRNVQSHSSSHTSFSFVFALRHHHWAAVTSSFARALRRRKSPYESTMSCTPFLALLSWSIRTHPNGSSLGRQCAGASCRTVKISSGINTE